MSEIYIVLVNETDNCTLYKNSRTYNEDNTLQGYVITLQNFEKLLKEGQQDGSVTISEKSITIKEDSNLKDKPTNTPEV